MTDVHVCAPDREWDSLAHVVVSSIIVRAITEACHRHVPHVANASPASTSPQADAHAAATKIQAGFRGMQARRFMNAARVSTRQRCGQRQEVMPAASCYFDELPPELCLEIFAFFSHFEVVSTLGQVCRRWLKLAQTLIGRSMVCVPPRTHVPTHSRLNITLALIFWDNVSLLLSRCTCSDGHDGPDMR